MVEVVEVVEPNDFNLTIIVKRNGKFFKIEVFTHLPEVVRHPEQGWIPPWDSFNKDD